MINNKYISLVLPCKDEGRALFEVLKKAPKEIDEIIVVNNNSKDETRITAKLYGAKVIKETRNLDGVGYGYALSTGIKEAKGNIVVCMDGDDSYPISDIPRLVDLLVSGNIDFISCNRIPFKDKKDMSLIRTTGVKILNLAIWALFGYRVKDCLSGMWVFRKEAINEMSLFEGGWNFSLEIKLNAIADRKLKIIESPIYYHDRVFNESKQNLFKTGSEHLFFLFKTKLKFAKRGFDLLSPRPTVVPLKI